MIAVQPPLLPAHVQTKVPSVDVTVDLTRKRTSGPMHSVMQILSSTNISGVRAPDRKVSAKTWRILRQNRPTFMGPSTDQWLKCLCATEFNPP